jgi:hypothetical protein
MGLFEHCEVLIQAGLLNSDMFKSLFGYRVENILANSRIVHSKLICEQDGWRDFLSLIKRLHLTAPNLS